MVQSALLVVSVVKAETDKPDILSPGRTRQLNTMKTMLELNVVRVMSTIMESLSNLKES